MRLLEVRLEDLGYLLRWRGGAFIAVWRLNRQYEHVPDHMVAVPESLKRSSATPSQIETAVRAWIGKNA
jgi:hypothetical protein